MSTCYNVYTRGWSVSTEEADPELRAERCRPRKISTPIKCQSHWIFCFTISCVSSWSNADPGPKGRASQVLAPAGSGEASQSRSAARYTAKRVQEELSGSSGYPVEPFVSCRSPGDHKQVTTLVDVRCSNLLDAGSIPAISTRDIPIAVCLLFYYRDIILSINPP